MRRHLSLWRIGLLLLVSVLGVSSITTAKQTDVPEKDAKEALSVAATAAAVETSTVAASEKAEAQEAVESLPSPSALRSDHNFTDFVQYNAVADQLTRNFFDQQRALSPNQQTQILDDIQQSVQRFKYQTAPDGNFFPRQKERSLNGFPKLNSDLTPPKPDFGSIFPISNAISNYPTLTPPPPPPQKPSQKTSTLRDHFRDQSNFVSPFVRQGDLNQNYNPNQDHVRDFKFANKPEVQSYNPYPTTSLNFQKNNYQQSGNGFNTNYQQNTGGSQFQSNGQSFQNNFPTNPPSAGPVAQNSHNGNKLYGNSNSASNNNNQYPAHPVRTTNTFQNTFNTQNAPTSSNNVQTFGNVYPSPNYNSFQTAQTTFPPPVRDTFSPDDAVKTISSQFFSSKQPTKTSVLQDFSPSPSSVKTFGSSFDLGSLKYQTPVSNFKNTPTFIESSASTKSYENYDLRGNEISTTSNPKVINYFGKPSQPAKNAPAKNSKIEIIKDSDVELDTTLLEKQIRQQLLSLNDQGENFPPSSFSFNPGNISSLPSFTFDDGNTISVPSEDKVEGTKQIKTIVIRQPTTTTTTTTTTIKPPSKVLEELTKNFPSGAKYEILKTSQDGSNLELEKSVLPANIQNQKKVTFVILEEQPDGSVKVQGVKSNNAQSQQAEVDSILKRIKDGELKLPQPSSSKSKSTAFQNPTKTTAKPNYIEYKTYSSPKPTFATPPPTFQTSSSAPILDYVTKPKGHFIPTPLESPSPEDLKTLYNDVTKDYYNDYVLTTKDEIHDQSSSFFLPTPNKKNNNADNYESNFVPTTSGGDNNYFISSKNSNYFQYSTPSVSSANPTDENKVTFDTPDQYKTPSTSYTPSYSSYSPTTPRPTTYRTPSISTTLLTRPTAYIPFLPTVPSPANDFSSPSQESFPSSRDNFPPNNRDNFPSNNHENFPSNNRDNFPSNSRDTFTSNSPPRDDFPSSPARESYPSPTSRYSTESPDSPATRIRLINTSPTTASTEDSHEGGWFKKPPQPKLSASSPPSQYYPLEDDFESAGSHHSVASSDEEGGNYERATTPDSPPPSHHMDSLNEVLKKNGLFAMAKFLRQSGLDQILNETGPYTIFVPTDKAFKALLVQLGGPDKAEEKFKENPRLLSGLLLHHVIPGAFKLESLQDEMTGVSLAGTQLRVNTYTVQDIEWNDVQVLTVNGGKVVEDKKDIAIPQGIAHAVDRVMFPLPVGDLLQTLQSDRDARFSHFLKVLQYSGLVSLFTGIKTYTVFAPINKGLPESQMSELLGDSLSAKKFILKHTVPGALYSAGMRYYQVKESMDVGQKLKLYKEAGRVKVNSAQVITRNIPATNGVVHAIEAPL